MKNDKLLTVLVIVCLVLSIFSCAVSVMLLRRIRMHDDLLQAMQVLVYTGKLAEDVLPENALVVHEGQIMDVALQDSMQLADAQPQQAEQKPTEAQQADEHKPAHKHPKHHNTAPKEDPSLHDHLLKIIAGESYVDLGLPSGTLWKAENEEGLMDFKTARRKFKKRMPSISQWEELCKYGEWSWVGNGYEVIGPNGAAIFIPAAGYRNISGQVGKVGLFGNYWSSTVKNKEEAWRFGFESDKFSMATHSRRYGRSIRLVYKPIIRDDDAE